HDFAPHHVVALSAATHCYRFAAQIEPLPGGAPIGCNKNRDTCHGESIGGSSPHARSAAQRGSRNFVQIRVKPVLTGAPAAAKLPVVESGWMWGSRPSIPSSTPIIGGFYVSMKGPDGVSQPLLAANGRKEPDRDTCQVSRPVRRARIPAGERGWLHRRLHEGRVRRGGGEGAGRRGRHRGKP